MKRRAWLRTLGSGAVFAIAGCTGGDGTEEAADAATASTTTVERTDEPSPTEAEPATEPETAATSGEPDVIIQEHDLVVDEGEFTTDVYVAATIENAGSAPSGTVELTADWYDADGDYLDNDKAFLQSLDAGEAWAARVYHLGSDSPRVDGYEFAGKFQTSPPEMNPEGLEVRETSMNVGDDEAVIRGRVTNDRSSTASYIQATAKIFDADDVVLGDVWTNVTDVPAGETWAFELDWRGRDRVAEAADHAVWVTDTAV